MASRDDTNGNSTMKASLQLTVNQHLTLTPQLQQAIRLLQLSTLELHQEIQQMIESNPLLELDIPNEKNADDSSQEITESATLNDVPLNQSVVCKELPVETAWEILYPNTTTQHDSSEETNNLDNIYCATPNLHEYLFWQMELTPFSEREHLIANTIIDSINCEGFLSVSTEDLLEGLNARKNNSDDNFHLDEVETVLKCIQHFDPVGIGAKNLSDCLLLQLNQLPHDTPHLTEAINVVTQYLNELGNHSYKIIMQALHLSEPVLHETMTLIKSLNPKPGYKLLDNKIEYIIPDVIVKKEEQRWMVELNPETISRVRLHDNYLNLLQKDNTSDKNYLKSNLQQARWFIKSIENRHETLLKVASSIVEKQQDFLQHGAEAMKPMILSDIATQLGFHESTISRITTQKFMYTPRGIFELKYFFSSHVTTHRGGECSSTALRAVIKKLIAAENRCKPLSDHKLSQLLSEQGIKIARRTIAKYREAMNIACSNERKTLRSD